MFWKKIIQRNGNLSERLNTASKENPINCLILLIVTSKIKMKYECTAISENLYGYANKDLFIQGLTVNLIYLVNFFK